MAEAAADWVRRRTGIVTTPPPRIRHSDRTAWDEDGRPTAPEPPPDVPFSARALAAGRHLVEVHDYYRQELAQVRDVLRQVADGAAQLGGAPGDAGAVAASIGTARGQLAQGALRANAWTLGGLCQDHCRLLAEHHSMETGAIFPHLRRSQVDLGAVLDRLDTEHDAIHDLIEDVDAALVRLAHDPADLGPVTAAIDLLTDALLSHFAYEERELVAPLARAGFYPGQL